MENRYLFRAKRIDNGEWAIGNSIYDGVTGQVFIHTVGNSVNESDKVEEEGCLQFVAFEVDPSTICKCTAMPDKNKKIVFEHDIVWDSDERAFYEIIWNQEDMCWNVEDADGHKYEFVECYGSTIEVNGNSFDNPELLEV